MGIIGLALVPAIIGSLGDSSKNVPATKAAPAPVVKAKKPAVRTGTVYITQGSYPAALDKADVEKVIEYVVQGDNAATQRMIDSGRVIILKEGLKVYLMETSLFSGLVKIRPEGQTIEVWTNLEAIKQ